MGDEYAEYYDSDTGSTDDLPFYLEYANRHGSPILELACGTGRLLVPMAEAGHTVHGIDISGGMLDRCTQKISERGLDGRAEVSKANMSEFDLPVKDYSMVFVAFRSFMHLFSQVDQLSCLQCVRDHLKQDGVLIVDVYAPLFHLLVHEKDEDFVLRREFDLPNGNRGKRFDRFLRGDVANQLQRSELRFEELSPSGAVIKETVVPLTTRYTFPFEMRLLMEKAGFEVAAMYRDYDKHPYDGTGEMIVVASRRQV